MGSGCTEGLAICIQVIVSTTFLPIGDGATIRERQAGKTLSRSAGLHQSTWMGDTGQVDSALKRGRCNVYARSRAATPGTPLSRCKWGGRPL